MEAFIPMLPGRPSGQCCLEGGTEAEPGAGLGLWAGLLVVRTRAEWTPDRLPKPGMSPRAELGTGEGRRERGEENQPYFVCSLWMLVLPESGFQSFGQKPWLWHNTHDAPGKMRPC